MLNRSKDTVTSETVIGGEDYSLPQFSSDAFTSFCATSPGEERRRFLESLSRDLPEDAQYFIWLDETGFLESLANFDNSIETIRKVPSYAGYRLLGTIAEGGSAKVFKASAERTGVTYAIKIPHQNDEESRERLHREFEILASVDSAHIPRPVAHSIVGDEPFLSMQLIDGRGDGSNRLDDILEMEDVPIDTKIQWFKELLSAMGELHSHGFVHLDIKLSNLLVGRGNAIYLIDFGIAVADCTFKPRLSRSDSILGTPPYVAPELLDGYEPSFTADIYSAGFLLLELLSQKRAHSKNEKLATLSRSLEPFDEVIEKACSKNPADRYQSASELSFAIDSATSEYSNYERIEALKRSLTWKVVAIGLVAAVAVLYVIGLEVARRNSLVVYAKMEEHLKQQGEFLSELQGTLTDTSKALEEAEMKSRQLQEKSSQADDELATLREFHENIASELSSVKEEFRVIKEQSTKAKGALLSVQDQLEQRQNIEDRVEQLMTKFNEVQKSNSETYKSLLDLKEQLEKMKPKE